MGIEDDFYATLKLKTGEEDDMDLGQSGISVLFKTMKNRMAKPKKIRFDISFVNGMNPYTGLDAFCRPEYFEQIGIAQGKMDVDKKTGEMIFTPGGNRWYVSHLDKSFTTKQLFNSDIFTQDVLEKMAPIVNDYFKYRSLDELEEICEYTVRMLDYIIDIQDYPVESAKKMLKRRSLGIGVTNLAYWHAKKGLRYGEKDALQEVKSWMEHQAYYLTETSVELAQERGSCKLSSQTYYGKGIFPWERRSQGVNELADFSPSMDWESLREKLLKYGIRNATLMAVAPVESSSVVLNSTNGIELPMELISVKESKAGSFVQVVPEYKRLKNRYQLMWEQKDCDAYLKTAAVLQVYVDQSISTNTFYNPAYYQDRKVPTTLIAKNLMLAHHWGIKTFYYSLINKQGAKAQEDLPTNVINLNFNQQDIK